MVKEGDNDNKINRERLGTTYESHNMDIEKEVTEEFIDWLDKTLPDVLNDEDDAFREKDQQEVVNKRKKINGKQSDTSKGKENVNKSKKQNETKDDSNGGNTEDAKEKEDKEKEGNSLDESINKKRDREADEENSPSKKRVRKSPNKKKVQKSKLGKGKNFNKKYKKARKCKDCLGEDEDQCILCGKIEHLCESEFEINKESKRRYVWIWICKECSEIMEDEKVMEEMKEVVKREKERKQNFKDAETRDKIYCCSLCEEVINKRQISVECICCKEWVHLKCSKFESLKEARDNKDAYVCAKCVKGHDTKKKTDMNNFAEKNNDDVEVIKNDEKLHESEGVKIYESDLETLKDGEWFNDNIISFAIDEMEEKNDSRSRNIVYVKPAVSHFIKESTNDEYVERTIKDLGIRKADWAFIPVNNETEKVGGSHWSLLLYSGSSNTFYHFDPIKGMNDRSVAMIVKKLIHKEKKVPEMKYVLCPRQKNSYDCGIYTIMYMEKIAENIEAGVEITKINDFDAKEYRKNLRRKIKEKYNLYLNDEKLKEKEESVSDEKKEEKITNKNETELNEQKKKEMKGECWHYTNKTCKFGSRCIYEHRQKCKDMIENGYCFEQKCRLGHPRICRDIYETGRCKRVICRHFHPINLRNRNTINQHSRKYNNEDIYETDRQNNRKQYNIYQSNSRHNNSYIGSEINKDMMQNQKDQWVPKTKRNEDYYFLENPNQSWVSLMEPIMATAMQTLAEKMWNRYH